MTRKIQLFDRDAGATEKFLFTVDLIMMVLIIINLLYILFYWSFGVADFREFIRSLSPGFYSYYTTDIYPNFFRYDLYFVVLFLAELFIRWVIAVARKTYTRWYFYPLVHWYDVLGCIPAGAFRWLRLLRVFAMTIRLHKMGIIDLRKTVVFKQCLKLWEIFLEELTDRVFINVLEAAKQEIIKESESKESPIAEALKPHREAMARWIVTRVRHVTETNYLKYRDELKTLIDTTVRDAFNASKQMQKVENIPLVGSPLVHALESTLQDIAFQLLDSSARNVYEKNGQLYEEALTSTFETLVKEEKDEEMNRMVKDILGGIIDRMKASIAEKRWMKV